jgi:hypothetical protein
MTSHYASSRASICRHARAYLGRRICRIRHQERSPFSDDMKETGIGCWVGLASTSPSECTSYESPPYPPCPIRHALSAMPYPPCPRISGNPRVICRIQGFYSPLVFGLHFWRPARPLLRPRSVPQVRRRRRGARAAAATGASPESPPMLHLSRPGPDGRTGPDERTGPDDRTGPDERMSGPGRAGSRDLPWPDGWTAHAVDAVMPEAGPCRPSADGMGLGHSWAGGWAMPSIPLLGPPMGLGRMDGRPSRLASAPSLMMMTADDVVVACAAGTAAASARLRPGRTTRPRASPLPAPPTRLPPLVVLGGAGSRRSGGTPDGGRDPRVAGARAP